MLRQKSFFRPFLDWPYVDDSEKTVTVYTRKNGILTKTYTDKTGATTVTTVDNASTTTSSDGYTTTSTVYWPHLSYVFEDEDGDYQFGAKTFIEEISGTVVSTFNKITVNFNGNESHGNVNVISSYNGSDRIYLTGNVGGEGDVRVMLSAGGDIVSGNESAVASNRGAVYGSQIQLYSTSGNIDVLTNQTHAEGLTFINADAGQDTKLEATVGDLFINTANADRGTGTLTLTAAGGIYGPAQFASDGTMAEVTASNGAVGDLLYVTNDTDHQNYLYIKKTDDSWGNITNDEEAQAAGRIPALLECGQQG